MYRNPLPTVDIIIELPRGVVLIERKNPPVGWALPGGFVDYGESLEHAAVREAKEETGLDVELVRQFYTYSDPDRDPRHHTLSTVFIASAERDPVSGSDARDAVVCKPPWPTPLVFDHDAILADYLRFVETREYTPLERFFRGV
jgi:8-oxo-dGTP diphosphatase